MSVKKKPAKKVAKKSVIKFPHTLVKGDTAFVARKSATKESVKWVPKMDEVYKRNIKILGWSVEHPEFVLALIGDREFFFHCKDLNRSSK
jgi:hypothetical protein